MHRRLLLEKLGAFVPGDPSERVAVERVLRFVKANPRCFERSLLAGHVTGSAWIIDPARERVLLTHHRKLGLWLQLGGHADGDPDVAAVALREAREESGLSSVRLLNDRIFDVDVHAIPARGEEPEHFHYDVRFLLEADRDEPLTVSEESHDLAWVAIDDVAGLVTDTSVLRMLAKT